MRFVIGHRTVRQRSSARQRNSARPRSNAKRSSSGVRHRTVRRLSNGRPHSRGRPRGNDRRSRSVLLSALPHSVRRPASNCRRMSCATPRLGISAISGRWRASSSPGPRRSSPVRHRLGHRGAWARAAASAEAVDAAAASGVADAVDAANAWSDTKKRTGEDTCPLEHAFASTDQKSRWTRRRPSQVSSDPVDRKAPVGSPAAVVIGTATRSRGSTLM